MKKIFNILLIIFFLLTSCMAPKRYIGKTKEPMLHSIEVINIDTGEHDFLKVKPGETIRLRAIPHSYTSEGDDVGEKISGFNPKWSAPHGYFEPNLGSDVLYIIPHNLGGYVAWWIDVTQTNPRGELIKAKIRLDIIK